jgi:hypothetical protein
MKDFHNPPAFEDKRTSSSKIITFFFNFCLSGSRLANPVPESCAFLTPRFHRTVNPASGYGITFYNMKFIYFFSFFLGNFSFGDPETQTQVNSDPNSVCGIVLVLKEMRIFSPYCFHFFPFIFDYVLRK